MLQSFTIYPLYIIPSENSIVTFRHKQNPASRFRFSSHPVPTVTLSLTSSFSHIVTSVTLPATLPSLDNWLHQGHKATNTRDPDVSSTYIFTVPAVTLFCHFPYIHISFLLSDTQHTLTVTLLCHFLSLDKAVSSHRHTFLYICCHFLLSKIPVTSVTFFTSILSMPSEFVTTPPPQLLQTFVTFLYEVFTQQNYAYTFNKFSLILIAKCFLSIVTMLSHVLSPPFLHKKARTVFTCKQPLPISLTPSLYHTTILRNTFLKIIARRHRFATNLSLFYRTENATL